MVGAHFSRQFNDREMVEVESFFWKQHSNEKGSGGQTEVE